MASRESASTARRILLADADAFYVSVARLVDPEGAGRASLLIVGGSVEGRGVVTSASYEARAFGVHSAMPMARAVRLCPDAMVVPVPWEACADKGREIRGVLERFAPVVEQASQDEFYLDMTGTERLYNDQPLGETARRIRETVRTQTGLTLSIGGAASKLVAKLAAGLAKPGQHGTGDGVYIVPPGSEGEFLRRFTLAELPGIGPKTSERFKRLGWHRVNDVLPLDPAAITARLGAGHIRTAQWLYRLVRGLDEAPVAPHHDPKSMSRDTTFPRDLEADEDLECILSSLVDRVTTDLRAAGLRARTVMVKLRDWDFKTRQSRRTLHSAVVSDRVVYDVARELLAKLRAVRRVPARLIGVTLSGFVREAESQEHAIAADAGANVETERDRTLARIMDEMRDRFGPGALRRGRAGGSDR
jgi:DNA polymerase-4